MSVAYQGSGLGWSEKPPLRPIAFAEPRIVSETAPDGVIRLRSLTQLAPYDAIYVPRTGVANVYWAYNQYFKQFLPNYGIAVSPSSF